jgi:hypothetical protein
MHGLATFASLNRKASAAELARTPSKPGRSTSGPSAKGAHKAK